MSVHRLFLVSSVLLLLVCMPAMGHGGGGDGPPPCGINTASPDGLQTCNRFGHCQECESCDAIAPPGEFVDVTYSGTWPNIVRIADDCNGMGTRSSDVTRYDCPAGKYCLGGLEKPQWCPANSESGANSAYCTCKQGFYSNTGKATVTDCHPCTAPAGRYCPAGSTNSQGVVCPIGRFCVGLSAAPFDCEAEPGFYCPAGSKTAQGVECPAGHYCKGGKHAPFDCPTHSHAESGQDACTCDAGYFNSPDGRVSYDRCSPCQAAPGSYCDSTFSGVVSPCPAGYYCKGGTHQPMGCKAPSGKYCESNSGDEHGIDCPAGFWCDGSNAMPAPCSLTEPGYYCPEGGYFWSGTKCPADHYCEGGQAPAVPCPPHSTSKPGSAECACVRGYYAEPFGTITYEGVCSECDAAPGEFCDCTSNNNHADCPVGWYCEGGTSQPKECGDTVLPGRYCPARTPSSDGIICPPGFFCPGGNAPHQQCPPGYYCPSPDMDAEERIDVGVSAPLDCEPGYYCERQAYRMSECCGDTTSLIHSSTEQDCMCKPGFYSDVGGNAPCFSCPIGAFCAGRGECVVDCPFAKVSDGATECHYCVGDTFPNTYNSECVVCEAPPGSSCKNPGTDDTTTPQGEDCDAGFICPGGATLQQPCPAGYYCDNPGMTPDMAKPCPVDMYCEEKSTGTTAGEDCPEGSHAPEGSLFGLDTQCICKVGYHRGGDGYCNACQPGYYCAGGNADEFECPANQIAETGSTPCHVCDPGLFPDNHNTECVACHAAAGWFCEDGTDAAGKMCEPSFSCAGGADPPEICPAGKDCSGHGTIKGSEPSCPQDHYCPLGTLQAPEVPHDCPEGSSAIDGSQTCGFGPCEYQDASQCDCKPGFHRDLVEGSGTEGTCIACDDGFFCSGGTGQPDECLDPYVTDTTTTCAVCTEPNTYPNLDNSGCEACQEIPGAYCHDAGSDGTGGSPVSTNSRGSPCAVNSYCPGDGTAHACPEGSNAPPANSFEDATECRCVAGYFRGDGSNGGDPGVCTKCAAGWYCAGHDQFGADVPPVQCGDGEVSDDGAVECHLCPSPLYPNSDYTACNACTAVVGFVCENQGQTDSTFDTGRACLEVGVSCTGGEDPPIPCPQGYWCSAGVATGCVAGEYCPDPSMTAPLACPDENYCPPLGEDPVECPAGEVSLGGAAECDFCGAGLFPDAARHQCLACAAPVGSDCFHQGTAETSLYDGEVCPAGVTCLVGSPATAVDCDPGYYCAGGSAPQVECVNGEVSDGTVPCAVCPFSTVDPINYQYPVSTYTSCSACVAPEGSACYDARLGPSWDASTDTTTVLGKVCADGDYCAGGDAQPVDCPMFSYCINQVRHACVAGELCDEEGLTAPKPCLPLGNYCSGDAPAEECGPAKYSNGVEECALCDPQTVTFPNEDHNACSGCIAVTGNYCKAGVSDVTGIPCEVGFTCLGSGLVAHTPCPPGHYCAGGAAAAVPCDPGKVSDGANECAYCPAGQFPDATQSDCQVCQAPLGSQCSNQGLPQTDTYNGQPCADGENCPGGAVAATPCEEGYYCDAGIQHACVAGQVCTETGLSSNGVNQPGKCSAGKYCPGVDMGEIDCPPGSTSPQDNTISGPLGCACEPEYRRQTPFDQTTPCIACVESDLDCPGEPFVPQTCSQGMVSDGVAPCHLCLATLYPNVAHTLCSECMAGEGFICLGGGTTASTPNIGVQCADGQWCAGGTSPSVPCPAGYTCTLGVRTACVAGEVCTVEGLSGGEQGACPEGFYCPGGSAGAIGCPTGSTSPAANTFVTAQQCTCVPGYQRNGQGNCVACDAGFVCAGEGSAQSECAGDQVSDGLICTTCPDGKFPNPTYTECVDCTAPQGSQCVVGTTSDGEVCSGAGTGQYCPGGTADPTNCPIGSFCVGGNATPCPPGKLCLTEGLTAGVPCDDGSYCAGGSAPAVDCFATMPGSVSEGGAVACHYCADGKFPNLAGTGCETCQAVPGKYCSGSGTAATTDSAGVTCPAGTVCTQTGTTDTGSPQPVDCAVAYPGSYCEGGNNPPSACTGGKVSDGTSTCTACTPPLYPKPDFSACESCQAVEGYACGIGGGIQTSTGEQCADGQYCAGTVADPVTCPVGSYCEDGIETACPDGKLCPEGSSAPQACPGGSTCTDGVATPCETGQVSDGFTCTTCTGGTSGTYPNTLQTACVACSAPAGSYCHGTGEDITNQLGSVCPAGTSCTGGTAPKVTCFLGTTCLDPSEPPVQCPADSYCADPSQEPTPCGEGKTSPPGSSTASQCTVVYDDVIITTVLNLESTTLDQQTLDDLCSAISGSIEWPLIGYAALEGQTLVCTIATAPTRRLRRLLAVTPTDIDITFHPASPSDGSASTASDILQAMLDCTGTQQEKALCAKAIANANGLSKSIYEIPELLAALTPGGADAVEGGGGSSNNVVLQDNDDDHKRMVIGLVLGLVLGFLVILAIVLLWRRHQQSDDKPQMARNASVSSINQSELDREQEAAARARAQQDADAVQDDEGSQVQDDEQEPVEPHAVQMHAHPDHNLDSQRGNLESIRVHEDEVHFTVNDEE